MKSTNKALTYWRKLPSGLADGFDNSICLLKAPEEAPAGTDPKRCIAICDRLNPKDVVSLAHSQGFTHVVQAAHSDFEQEVCMAARMISDPMLFLKDPAGEILGITRVKNKEVSLTK